MREIVFNNGGRRQAAADTAAGASRVACTDVRCPDVSHHDCIVVGHLQWSDSNPWHEHHTPLGRQRPTCHPTVPPAPREPRADPGSPFEAALPRSRVCSRSASPTRLGGGLVCARRFVELERVQLSSQFGRLFARLLDPAPVGNALSSPPHRRASWEAWSCSERSGARSRFQRQWSSVQS